MLEMFQLRAVGMRSLTMSTCVEHLACLQRNPDQRELGLEALHYYDAYMMVTSADPMTAITPDFIRGFPGFLAAECSLDETKQKFIQKSVMHFLSGIDILTSVDVPYILACDQAMAKELYFGLRPSAAVKEYYECHFKTADGQVLQVDFNQLSFFDMRSRESLRGMLKPYLLIRDNYEADTDARLIVSLARGMGASWPGIPFGSFRLGMEDSRALYKEVMLESDLQMRRAGYDAVEIELNRQFLLRVTLGFFVPYRLMYNINYQALT
ncbi:hypothetical protein [Stutzerimonas xanthomarina]|uniref:hypothetical protein n=1 Tax=Stutzerimonas xanthomarina TaxID=271420 RepID=UPI003AA8DA71